MELINKNLVELTQLTPEKMIGKRQTQRESTTKHFPGWYPLILNKWVKQMSNLNKPLMP